MTATILVVGATGNTGRGVVETLSKLLETSNTLSGSRILALTRSLENPVAQRLAGLPGVEFLEKNWVEITADWLRKQGVTRAFIASHTEPNQFPEESGFHLAALQAGIQYVVRISTAAANVRPDCVAYYPRSHWAVEALLSSPEFAALQWTSLQPNLFANFAVGPAAALIKEYRKTGKQDTLRLMVPEHAPLAIIDPWEIGVLAAHLLAEADPSPHNKARYVVNGPEDITGPQIVKLVEEYIGTRVENVSFGDMSWVEAMIAAMPSSKGVLLSVKHSLDSIEDEKWVASATSNEVLKLSAPTRTVADALKDLLEE